MPVPLIIVLSVIGGLIILLLIIPYGFYRFVFYSPMKWQNNDYALDSSPAYKGKEERIRKLIDSLKAREYEDVYITSFDKTKLHARLFEIKDSKKVAILCHGYRGTGYRDFCGGAKEALELGYSVILIDQRAHGLSKGHSITFGVRETKDIVKWSEYARNRFGEDIKLALIGISMGGASVLMAADKVKNVRIIADCPFSSPQIMLKETLRKMKLPIPIFYPLLNLSSIIYAHTNLNKASAYLSVKATNNKILIIHGDHDSIVPYWISKELYDANTSKIQYELFPNAEHGMSYLEDTSRYQITIKDFLQ